MTSRQFHRWKLVTTKQASRNWTVCDCLAFWEGSTPASGTVSQCNVPVPLYDDYLLQYSWVTHPSTKDIVQTKVRKKIEKFSSSSILE